MGNFVTSSHKKLFKDTMNKLRDDIGHKISIVAEYTQSQTINCPNCKYSVVDQQSANIYDPDSPYPSGIPGPKPFADGSTCPVCEGDGVLPSVSTDSITTKAKAFLKEFNTEDTNINNNDAKIIASYGIQNNSNIRLKFDSKYHEIVSQASYFLIYGKKYYNIITPSKRGIGDLTQTIAYVSDSDKFQETDK